MGTAIRFEGVSKTFNVTQSRSIKDKILGISGHRPRREKVSAVTDLDFTVSLGESLAILGHNGSGKSTALKMLAGVLAPSTGRIWARGRIAPLLELGAGFHPDLTGRENIYLNAAILGISRKRLVAQFDEIVAFAEVEDALDTPVKFYSSGMAVRLGFAVAVHVDPDILLIDEVLAVGDAEFQSKCLAHMASLKHRGCTVLFVTHSLEQAQQFCDRAIVLAHGVCTYDGLVSSVADAYARSSRSAPSMSAHNDAEG